MSSPVDGDELSGFENTSSDANGMGSLTGMKNFDSQETPILADARTPHARSLQRKEPLGLGWLSPVEATPRLSSHFPQRAFTDPSRTPDENGDHDDSYPQDGRLNVPSPLPTLESVIVKNQRANIESATIWKRHRIRDGDSLPELAQKYLGDANRYMEIYHLNRDILTRPDLLPIRKTLRIPIELAKD